MQPTPGSKTNGSPGRKLSRRGVLAGIVAAPLALELSRASSLAAPQHSPSNAPVSQAAGRIVHSTNPPLEETPLSALEGLITPTSLHFIRNHGASPEIDTATWRLVIDGEVDRPFELTYDDLRRLPSKSVNMFLECAGNGRSNFQPAAQGTQWGQGAVSVAEWTGVPLGTVMEMAGMRSNTVHVIARGGDSVGLTRGLPADHAMRPETLLAWGMNGEPLPRDHGFPLRLVVPGWIGVASVKWLQRLTASPVPHQGQHQTANYMVYREGQEAFPATLQPVKSVIARPTPGSVMGGAPVLVSGFAWSGSGQIIAVDVRADDGQSWQPARLLEPVSPLHWVRWDFEWLPSAAGSYTLMSRATDETGATQPASVAWNRLGYGYNALQPVQVTVGTAAAAAAGQSMDQPSESSVISPEPPSGSAPAPGGETAQGQEVYARACASCHAPDGQGGTNGPLVIGEGSSVRSVSKEELFAYIKENMPYREPNSLSDAEYLRVTEFLRSANGLSP